MIAMRASRMSVTSLIYLPDANFAFDDAAHTLLVLTADDLGIEQQRNQATQKVTAPVQKHRTCDLLSRRCDSG
jgi:hypothetical protein